MPATNPRVGKVEVMRPDFQTKLSHPVVGSLKRSGRMNDQERSVDRLPEGVAIADVAAAEFGSDQMSEVAADLGISSQNPNLAGTVAGKRLCNPSAKDSVAADHADDTQRFCHSSSTHPLYRTISPKNGAVMWTSTRQPDSPASAEPVTAGEVQRGSGMPANHARRNS